MFHNHICTLQSHKFYYYCSPYFLEHFWHFHFFCMHCAFGCSGSLFRWGLQAPSMDRGARLSSRDIHKLLCLFFAIASMEDNGRIGEALKMQVLAPLVTFVANFTYHLIRNWNSWLLMDIGQFLFVIFSRKGHWKSLNKQSILNVKKFNWVDSTQRKTSSFLQSIFVLTLFFILLVIRKESKDIVRFFINHRFLLLLLYLFFFLFSFVFFLFFLFLVFLNIGIIVVL